MEFLRQACERAAESSQRPPLAPSPAAKERKILHAWRRLSMMLWHVATAALHASLVQRLVEINLSKGPTVTSAPQTSKPSSKAKRPTVVATAKCRPLPPSVTKKYALRPEDCSHPEDQLANRGCGPGDNQSWVTCLRCGSRWERLRTEGEQLQKAIERGSTSVECLKCHRPMVLRINNPDDSLFLGCSGFPMCRATQRYRPGTAEAQTPAVASASPEVPPPPQTFRQQLGWA